MTNVLDLVLLLLATFWAWETVRYALERFVPSAFYATRVAHPLAVAVLPLVVLWPDWVAGLAVAGATGLLVALVDHTLGHGRPAPVSIPSRTRRGTGLPPLP